MPRKQFARYPGPPKLTMLLWSALRARINPGCTPGRLKSWRPPGESLTGMGTLLAGRRGGAMWLRSRLGSHCAADDVVEPDRGVADQKPGIVTGVVDFVLAAVWGKAAWHAAELGAVGKQQLDGETRE